MSKIKLTFLTLKTEAADPCKTLAHTCQTTQCYSPHNCDFNIQCQVKWDLLFFWLLMCAKCKVQIAHIICVTETTAHSNNIHFCVNSMWITGSPVSVTANYSTYCHHNLRQTIFVESDYQDPNNRTVFDRRQQNMNSHEIQRKCNCSFFFTLFIFTIHCTNLQPMKHHICTLDECSKTSFICLQWYFQHVLVCAWLSSVLALHLYHRC